MSNTPIQVSYSLEEILVRIEGKIDKTNQKLEKIDDRLTKLEVGQARIESEFKGDIKALDQKFSGQIKSVDEKLSGQIKSVDEKLSGQINTLEEKTSNLAVDIKDIKGSQRAQIWTLIGVLSTTVVGAVIRFVITGIPSNP